MVWSDGAFLCHFVKLNCVILINYVTAVVPTINIHIAADHPACKVKNLWRQRPTWNFPDSHHAQLVLPHSSTHIMHHNAWLQGSVCTCHCNTPNSRGSMVITLYNTMQLDMPPFPSHMMCINAILLYKMLYTSQNFDHVGDDPLFSLIKDCKIRAWTYSFNVTTVWGMRTWEEMTPAWECDIKPTYPLTSNHIQCHILQYMLHM